MTTTPPEPDAPQKLAEARAALATSAPLVQCLTNRVVTTITANVLLAVGAAPAMVDNVHEAADFARIASAVLINLGTPDDMTAAAMRLAAEAAAASRTPWVLDPVAVGGLAFRTALAHDLLQYRPTVIRGNASEVIGLAGAGQGGRGVDSTAGSDEALPAARDLAARTGAVVAVSGVTDLIVSKTGTARIRGGSVLLTRTTGAGCALGGLTAAYTAVTDDPFIAAVAAHLHVAIAAEEAEALSAGPGSFAVAWIDRLDAVGPDDLAAGLIRRLG